MGQRKRSERTSEESSMPEIAFGMFFGGVALLVLPRLTTSLTIQNLLAPMRTLGMVLMTVGFVTSMLVVWRMMFGGRDESSLRELQTDGEAREPQEEVGELNAQSHGDSVSEQFGVMYGQRASPKGIDGLESALDVEKMLDIIEWRRFEAVVERCYQLQGFSTSTKQHGADGGVDIKLYREENPDELAGVVQCKHWGRRYVGVEQLRALRGSMADFKASQGYFVTSSTFTQDALEYARGNQIEVVERDQLIATVMGFRADERESVLKVALTGRYDVPTCASCGTKMVKRSPRRGGQEFWGCLSYPRCRSVIRIGRRK
jgi:restriction system protein